MGFHKLNGFSHKRCLGANQTFSRLHINIYYLALCRSKKESSSHELLTDCSKLRSAISTRFLFIGTRYDFISGRNFYEYLRLFAFVLSRILFRGNRLGDFRPDVWNTISYYSYSINPIIL